MVGGVLHDNDGIVHHDADAQDQGEQRHQVDAEAQHHHGREGADNGHRHGGGGHQGGAPALQKHHDDDEHQEAGLKKRPVNVVDSLLDEFGGVVVGTIGQARGEFFTHFGYGARTFWATSRELAPGRVKMTIWVAQWPLMPAKLL